MIVGVLVLHNSGVAQWDTVPGFGGAADVWPIDFRSNGTGTMLHEFEGHGHYSLDDGTTWSAFNIAQEQWRLSKVQFTSSTKAWALGGTTDEFYHSSDAGSSWAVQDSAVSVFDFLDENLGYYFKTSGADLIVNKTADGGVSWQPRDTLLNVIGLLKGMKVVSDSVAYAWTQGALYKSTEDGGNWNFVSATAFIKRAQVLDSINIFGFTWMSNPLEIFVSSDGGNSWDTLLAPSPFSGYVTDVSWLNPLAAVAVCSFAVHTEEIYTTIDGGLTWQNNYNAVGGSSFISVAHNSAGRVFAANWRSHVISNEIVHGQRDLNEARVVLSAYPSPTASEIRFRTEDGFEDRQVSLKLFDLSGKLLLTESNQKLQEMVLDVNHLANGMYLYRIDSDDGFVQAGKFQVQH
jgi:photosystem II stability/assembly factor-like uncharacterized protein